MKISPVVTLATAAVSLFATDNNVSNPNTVTMDTIKVQGSSTLSRDYSASTGSLGSKSVLDTPFSLSVVDSDAMSDRQVHSLENLFLRDASVNMNTGTYSSFGSTMSVRGLMLSYTDSYKVNGLPVNSFTSALPYEVFEQVEVLKGLSGFMYGFGTPGGIVNYVTKKPTESPTFSLSAGYRNNSIFTQAVDAGGRVGEDKRFGYRVNLVNEQGDTANNDGADGTVDRQTASAAVDYRFSDRLSWDADLIFNKRRVENSASWINSIGIGADDALPKPVNGSRNIGIPGTYEESENIIMQTGIDYLLNDNWHLNLDYSKTENNTRFIKTLATLTSTEGNLSSGIYHNDFDVDFDSWQLMTEGAFETGTIAHQVTAGVRWTETKIYRGVANGTERRVVWGYASDNLYDPQDIPSYPGALGSFTPKKPAFTETTQQALFLSDTLQLADAWSLLLGARLVSYEHTAIWSDSDPYEKEALTPTAALTYKPSVDTSYYLSYVQSLEEGSTVPETLVSGVYKYSNHDKMLSPLTSTQYELGFKTERDAWTANVALFRIERGAEIDEAADAPYTYTLVQDGIELYQGVELAGAVQPHEDWLLSASLMMMNATYEAMGVSSTVEGNDVAGATDTQGTLEATYAVPSAKGLKLTAGARHTGETPVDQNNNWEMDAVTLYDFSANYKTRVMDQNLLTLRCAVTNLTDEEYWASAGYEDIRIGEPRMIALNAQIDW